MTGPETEPNVASRERTPSLQLLGTNLPGLYEMRGTREGYAALARHFASLAESAPGEYAFQSPKWKQLADELESAFASGPRYGSIFGCTLVDELRDEPIPNSPTTFKHRLGLFGCVAAVTVVLGVLLRGLVALWADLS